MLYRTYGKTGLLSRKNQDYSVDFKLKVLKAIDKEHLSLSETRLKFNISSDSIILKWQKDFTTFGIEGLQPKQRGRPISMSDYKRKKRKSDKPLTREELLNENERLRCENELLKKLKPGKLIEAFDRAAARLRNRHDADLSLAIRAPRPVVLARPSQGAGRGV